MLLAVLTVLLGQALGHEPPPLPPNALQVQPTVEVLEGTVPVVISGDPDWRIFRARAGGIAMPDGWHHIPSWGPIALRFSGVGVAVPEFDEHGAPVEMGIVVEALEGGGSLERHSRRFARKMRGQDDRVVLAHRVEEGVVCGDAPALVHYLRVQDGDRVMALQRVMVLDREEQAWSAMGFVRTGPDSVLSAEQSPVLDFLEPWLLSYCPRLEMVDTSALDLAWIQQQGATR